MRAARRRRDDRCPRCQGKGWEFWPKRGFDDCRACRGSGRMPTYDYLCDACGHEEERFQSIRDGSTPECPECRTAMRRLISGGGFILKGKDWPGKEIRRASEDGKVSSVGRRARELKEKGKVPVEDRLTFKDVERMNPEQGKGGSPR